MLDDARSGLKQFVRSKWCFPVLLLLPLLIFTILGIHGSSVGAYRNLLYGPTKDGLLLANEPRAIRSDEWLGGTQQTIAQSAANFPLVNQNLGNGQDMSITDSPYKEWSILFKPQNLAFLVMPLENAFAFKWWLMGYLLVVSCYFFVLKLLPNRKLLASGIALSLFFAPFVHWWYAYGTLGSLFYSLFIMTAALSLLAQQNLRKKLLWGGLLAYLVACFALVLYPPFQIACGMVAAAFLASCVIKRWRKPDVRNVVVSIMIVAISSVVGFGVVGAFLATRSDTIHAITNSDYPGKRSDKSGGVMPLHPLSSHLAYQFLEEKQTGHYLIDGKSPSNQSETSNFLLLVPFLIAPSALLLFRQRHRKKQDFDWPLLSMCVLAVVFTAHLFVSQFSPVAKILLLDQVADGRVLIGFGLLNIVMLALVIRHLSANKQEAAPRWAISVYCLLVLLAEIFISLAVYNVNSDQFISLKRTLLFSLPLPLVVYFLLKKRFTAAVLLYFAFSFMVSARVNPLYNGLSSVTNNPLSAAVSELGAKSDKRWASEGGYLENIALMNGEKSLSGVYNYPQLELWENIPDVKKSKYNRYAHVGIQVVDEEKNPELTLISPDSFVIKTGACDPYLRKMNVGFYVTASVLKSSCLEVAKTVSLPGTTIYIYKVVQND